MLIDCHWLLALEPSTLQLHHIFNHMQRSLQLQGGHSHGIETLERVMLMGEAESSISVKREKSTFVSKLICPMSTLRLPASSSKWWRHAFRTFTSPVLDMLF